MIVRGIGRSTRRDDLPLERVGTIEVRTRPYRRNALIGAVFPGILLGVALKDLGGLCIFCSQTPAEERRGRVIGFAAGVAAGAEIGLWVAHLNPRWQRRFPPPVSTSR